MPFALYILAIALFVMSTSEFVLAGLLPAIAADLNIAIGTAGLLTSAFAIGMVVGAPLMAAFARRWPHLLTLAICLLVFAGVHVVAALTPAFSILLVIRVLSAVANAGFTAVALSLATTLVPENRKGRALAILLSGTTLATVIGVPLGTLIGHAAGWRMTLWVLALLCLPVATGIVRQLQSAQGLAQASVRTTRLSTELAQLASPPLLLTMCLGALVNGATFTTLTYLAPIVTDVAGLSDVWTSVALALFGIGSFIGITIAGRLSDQHPGFVLLGGGTLLLLGWIAMATWSSHPALALAVVFSQGVLSFGVGSTLITRVLYTACGAPTMAGSYATATLNIGAAVGPVLGALALTTGLGAVAPLWVAAALTATALLLMLVTSLARRLVR